MRKNAVAALQRQIDELRLIVAPILCTCGPGQIVDFAETYSCEEERGLAQKRAAREAAGSSCPMHPDARLTVVEFTFGWGCKDALCECHTLPGHRAPGCATPGLGCPTCRPDFWERRSPPPPAARSVVKAADGYYSPIAHPAPRASAPAPDHLPGYYLGPLAGPRELALAAAGFARATSALEPVLFSGFCSRRGCFHTHQEHGRGGCTAQVIGSASLCPCKSFLTKEMT